MDHFLNHNIADDISEASTDSDFAPEDLIHLMNNHPDMPLDAEEMEDYIEDIVELYELQYRRRPNESGDPPNILVIRHLVEQERNVLFDLPGNENGFQNQFQHLQLDYHPTSSGGDMPQFFLEEEDIQNVNTINIVVAKKVRLVKRRYKTTKRTSKLNLSDNFPAHLRYIQHVDLHDPVELPNEAGDEGVTFNLLEDEDDPSFNISDFEFSFPEPMTNRGDMAHNFLDEMEGILNIKKITNEKQKEDKMGTRTAISEDNFRKSRKNRFKSESSLRKKLQTYRRQSDVYIRRYGNR